LSILAKQRNGFKHFDSNDFQDKLETSSEIFILFPNFDFIGQSIVLLNQIYSLFGSLSFPFDVKHQLLIRHLFYLINFKIHIEVE
jgi:hypothetical protein